jgi:hypothetical protein
MVNNHDCTGTIERLAGSTTAENLGINLQESKQIVNLLQQTIVKQQLQEHCEQRRKCPTCGTLRPVKDYRRTRLDTVLAQIPRLSDRILISCGLAGAFSLRPPLDWGDDAFGYTQLAVDLLWPCIAPDSEHSAISGRQSDGHDSVSGQLPAQGLP